MKRFLIALLLALPALPALSAEKKVPTNGACEVRIEGDVTMSYTATLKGTDVTADHWMFPGAPMPLRVFHVDCGNQDGVMLALWPSWDSMQKDIPMAAGRYKLEKGTIEKPPGPGIFTAKVHIGKGKTTPSFTVVPASGAVELTRFDKKGMAGKFSFKATEDGGPRKVSISGTFNYTR